MNKKLLLSSLVFAAAFALYLFTSVPAITEDDSGELCGDGVTLGIAHSPGYPLYCMASKIFVTVVPFGSNAYRVNLASSLGIAACCAVLFLICLEISGSMLAALASALAFACSASVWDMANVTEVYGLAAIITALLWFVMQRAGAGGFSGKKYLYCAMFLFGMGLCAHYTLGLLLPGIIWWAAANRDRLFDSRWKTTIIYGILWSLAGFSAVLYLYVRAQSAPVFGWEDPKTLERFWQVIARLRYGTVSLAQGGAPPLSPEILIKKIMFYFSELNANFTIAGSLLFAAGIYRFFKDKRCGWTLFIMILGSGPGFVMLSNVGVDAGSKELMERFFFLSYVFAAVVISGGLGILPKYVRGASLFLPVFLLWQNYPALNHRPEYMYYDCGRDILKTTPPKTLLFSDRADEMEFAVAYLHSANGMRPDIKFIDCNAGATRSVYGDGYYRVWGKPRLAIRERVESEMINSYPGPVYYATFFPDMINIKRESEGLLFRAKPLERKKVTFPFDEVYVFRVPEETRALNGRLNGLVLSYHQLLGEYNAGIGEMDKAKRFFSGVSAYDEDGKWTAGIGFYLHKQGMADDAAEYYLKAINKGAGSSEIYVNLGAIYEQKGQIQEAMKYYGTAISISPDNLQAHYNLAVSHWKRGEWNDVIREFKTVLQIDPSNADARRYLDAALAKAGKPGGKGKK